MKLKAGIIGLGVGEQHIAGYNAHPQCEVTRVCDLSDQKLEEVLAKYPRLKVTRDAREILEDPEIDVVSIASFDDAHYEQAVQAIKNGKHAFIEKPLCLYEDQAQSIRALLKTKPELKISSNLILRLSPRFQRLKQRIEQGEFGKLFSVEADYLYGRLEKITQNWRGQLDFYSVIYGGGVHVLDLLLWLTQDTVDEVMAYGNQIASQGTQFKYNDCVLAALRFKSGLVGKVSANFGCVHPHFHPVNIYGTKATFKNEVDGGKIFHSSNPQERPEVMPEAYPGVPKGALLYGFVESILKGSAAQVSADDVFKTMAVCFAIEKSMTQQKPVKVQYF